MLCLRPVLPGMREEEDGPAPSSPAPSPATQNSSKKHGDKLKMVFTFMVYSMDEGTLKTPIPLCRLHWSFCMGW